MFFYTDLSGFVLENVLVKLDIQDWQSLNMCCKSGMYILCFCYGIDKLESPSYSQITPATADDTSL